MQDNNIIQDAINCIKRLDKENAELKAENVEIKISYINFIAKLKREMITKDDIQDLKHTVKNFVEEYNSLILEIERLKRENEIITGMHNSSSNRFDKLYNTLQEIKAIAERPSPYIDNFEIKTVTEVGYDYAAICNELEFRLHKVLELITKAEKE